MEAPRVARGRGSHITLDKRLTDGGKVVSPTRRPIAGEGQDKNNINKMNILH
jgi:hypothetical protein